MISGLVPLITGVKYKQTGLGVGGFFASAIAGAVLGLLLAIPISGLFTWLAVHYRNSSNATSEDLSTTEKSMKTFRVYSYPYRTATVVVKVGFSWWALIFAPFWFMTNRMWTSFFTVISLIVGAFLYFKYSHPITPGDSLIFFGLWALYLIAIFTIGMVANPLLCSDLEDQGYQLIATVKARNASYAREEAEKAAIQHEPKIASQETLPEKII